MTGSAAYGIAPDVGHVDSEVDGASVAYVARLPEGPPLVLADSAAVIWGAARTGGTLDEIVDRVAEAFDVPPAEIVGDVTAFVEQLVTLGLLVRSDD
ncbi:PqqD family protein [Intrasporangium sp. DVR]|uniref:PqqD family protein n=1 Tax=Intrasporangium sp. DVR TaxID=3127867 RepID=UPI00313A5E14